MKTARYKLIGATPLSQGRPHTTPKLERESFDAYDKRTWRERLNVTELGYVFIPQMAIKDALTQISRYLGEKIPGKGNATYTKHFEAGVIVLERIVLSIKKDKVEYEDLFVPADGEHGSGKRVWKRFPIIPSGWEANAEIIILDEIIDEKLLTRYFDAAGKFIGVGRFRPQRGGFYGRFGVDLISFE